MTLIETIIHEVRKFSGLEYFQLEDISEEDEAILKNEILSQIPAMHIIPDRDELWIDEDKSLEEDIIYDYLHDFEIEYKDKTIHIYLYD